MPRAESTWALAPNAPAMPRAMIATAARPHTIQTLCRWLFMDHMLKGMNEAPAEAAKACFISNVSMCMTWVAGEVR